MHSCNLLSAFQEKYGLSKHVSFFLPPSIPDICIIMRDGVWGCFGMSFVPLISHSSPLYLQISFLFFYFFASIPQYPKVKDPQGALQVLQSTMRGQWVWPTDCCRQLLLIWLAKYNRSGHRTGTWKTVACYTYYSCPIVSVKSNTRSQQRPCPSPAESGIIPWYWSAAINSN